MEIVLKDYLEKAFSEKIIQECADGSVMVVFGTTYDDLLRTPMRFKLTKCDDDCIKIDDEGLTFQYLDEIFELGVNDVMQNVDKIKEFYEVETTDTELKSAHLTKKVSIDSNILIELFRFRDCIAFLNSMKIFYT